MAGHCSPVPPQETLKHAKGGLTQSLWAMGPGAQKVLFETFKHLWQVWDLILNVLHPSYNLAGAYPLPLDIGVFIFVGSNILLSMVVQQ